MNQLFSDLPQRTFAVRLWEGTVIPATEAQPTLFTLVIQHPAALRSMFSDPTELRFGEAYIYNDYDIEGDVESAVRVGRHLMHRRTLRERLKLRSLLSSLDVANVAHPQTALHLSGTLHSKERDRSAIRYHYDVANDFYALFLDSRMIYSTARFEHPGDTLEAAQLNKLENICRALELRPHQRMLDIGCGWGGLIMFAVKNFGVNALGITLSEERARFARTRSRAAALEDCCRVGVRDYRDVNEVSAFDKIASVGMVEHVGARQLPEYFRRVCRLLVPGGMFLNSGISRPVTESAHHADSFVDAYVFPDGELEPIDEMIRAAELAGFELRSTEDLNEDYAQTLRHWMRRLEEHTIEAHRIADDVTYRVWRLYMAGSAERFSSGDLHVYQTLLVKHEG